MKTPYPKSRFIKISLDFLMLVILLLLYQKRTISMTFHEWGGISLFGLFLIHKLLNAKWIQAATCKVFRKGTNFRLRFSWVVDLLLLLSMSGIIVTGLMISKTLPFRLNGSFAAKQWHYFLAALSILLMGIHLGLHWPLFKGLCRKHPLLTAKAASTLGIFVLIAAMLWGGYSLITGSFGRWIAGPFTAGSMEFRGGMPDWGEGEAPTFQGERPEGETSDTEESPAFAMGKPRGKGGKGMGAGGGQGMGKGFEYGGNNGVDVLNILSVIATYASEMLLFAAVTAWLTGRKKKTI